MTGQQSFDVVVIGGGLMGWSTAYRLASDGVPTLVVDRADAGYATQAGAGIISPGASQQAPGPFYDLAKEAVRYYPRLLDELAADSAGDTGYEVVGSLFIARDEIEAAELPEVYEQMVARRDSGMGNIGELTMLTPREAQRHFPPLADLPGAIHLSGAARVNGRLLQVALRRGAETRGAVAREGSASIVMNGDRASGVSIDSEFVAAGAVVIAGGAWSSSLGEEIGIRLPIYPQRGQIIHLHMQDADTSAWPIIQGFLSHYILTFRPNRVVAGATREHDSGYDVRMTAGGVQEVLNVALGIAPGLADAKIAEIRIGLRPYSPDQLPVLGHAPGKENVFLCTGHGPSGLQLGPFSGAVVAALITGRDPGCDVSPFLPDRYQHA
jgi:D-amino-acid dehydrogenase